MKAEKLLLQDANGPEHGEEDSEEQHPVASAETVAQPLSNNGDSRSSVRCAGHRRREGTDEPKQQKNAIE